MSERANGFLSTKDSATPIISSGSPHRVESRAKSLGLKRVQGLELRLSLNRWSPGPEVVRLSLIHLGNSYSSLCRQGFTRYNLICSDPPLGFFFNGTRTLISD